MLNQGEAKSEFAASGVDVQPSPVFTRPPRASRFRLLAGLIVGFALLLACSLLWDRSSADAATTLQAEDSQATLSLKTPLFGMSRAHRDPSVAPAGFSNSALPREGSGGIRIVPRPRSARDSVVNSPERPSPESSQSPIQNSLETTESPSIPDRSQTALSTQAPVPNLPDTIPSASPNAQMLSEWPSFDEGVSANHDPRWLDALAPGGLPQGLIANPPASGPVPRHILPSESPAAGSDLSGEYPNTQPQTGASARPISQPAARLIPGQTQSGQSPPPTPVPPVPQPEESIVPTIDPVEPSLNNPQNDSRSAAGSSPPVLRQPAPSVVQGHSIGTVMPGTSGFRATVEADAEPWLAPFYGRISGHSGPAGDGFFSGDAIVPVPAVALSPRYEAWWESGVQTRAGLGQSALPLTLEDLIHKALLHSPQVLALQAEPEVQQRVVWQEQAAFDWQLFWETKYNDLNDPVGNSLTTGDGQDRFEDRKVTAQGGLRRRNSYGGEFELSQQLAHQDTNSRFFVPGDQGTTRLELSYRQPLMNGSGEVYNRSEIVLAQITRNSASDEVIGEIQDHLVKVTEAYWSLYRARAELFQRRKLYEAARKVLQTLEGRQQVDTIPRQILRATAAVTRAEARLQRAVTTIRNAESQIRLLVNAPEMLQAGSHELLPAESPSLVPIPVSLDAALKTALLNRPDVSRAIRQMRASSVRLGVSKADLLPRLDLLVSSYVAGLQGRSDIATAYGEQFTDGRPGYTLGLEFELPLGNRAAKARHEQRKWELTRSIHVFRASVEAALTEVEVATREVETTHREMLGRYQTMVAAENESRYLTDRFETLPLSEESAVLLLEDLLDSYERRADEEAAFTEARVNYVIATMALRQATGTLLRTRYGGADMRLPETEWMERQVADGIRNAAGSTAVRESLQSMGDQLRRSETGESSLGQIEYSEPEWAQQSPRFSEPPSADDITRAAAFSRREPR